MGKAFSFNAGDRGFESRLRISTFFFFFLPVIFFFWRRLVGKELMCLSDTHLCVVYSTNMPFFVKQWLTFVMRQ